MQEVRLHGLVLQDLDHQVGSSLEEWVEVQRLQVLQGQHRQVLQVQQLQVRQVQVQAHHGPGMHLLRQVRLDLHL